MPLDDLLKHNQIILRNILFSPSNNNNLQPRYFLLHIDHEQDLKPFNANLTHDCNHLFICIESQYYYKSKLTHYFLFLYDQFSI